MSFPEMKLFCSHRFPFSQEWLDKLSLSLTHTHTHTHKHSHISKRVNSHIWYVVRLYARFLPYGQIGMYCKIRRKMKKERTKERMKKRDRERRGKKEREKEKRKKRQNVGMTDTGLCTTHGKGIPWMSILTISCCWECIKIWLRHRNQIFNKKS